VASAQINLKIDPLVAIDWKRRAAADRMGMSAWVTARVAEALAGGAAPPAADGLAARVEALEAALRRLQRPAPGPAPAPPAAPRPTPAAAPPAEVPAEAITTGELADRLALRRPTLNARIARAGGLAVGLELAGWRCVGLKAADRGGPPRGLWLPAGTGPVPEAEQPGTTCSSNPSSCSESAGTQWVPVAASLSYAQIRQHCSARDLSLSKRPWTVGLDRAAGTTAANTTIRPSTGRSRPSGAS
jgi:hypothetical protein